MLKGEDLKVLNFRDELMELLNKYNLTLTGDNKDNGDMVIDTGNQYTMSNSFDNYSITRYDCKNDTDVNLMEEYILGSFKGHTKHDFFVGNHANYDCGIITNDKFKAEMLIDKIFNENESNVIKYVNGKNYKCIYLKNGYRYIWIKPTMRSRGYRCQSAYIDKTVSKEIFDKIIYPIMGLYAGENDVKVF